MFLIQSSGLAPNPLLSALRDTLRSRNPAIGHVAVLELRAFAWGDWPYVLLGYGVRNDRTFRGDFRDELFGVFVADTSLARILRTVDVFPTPRWRDYTVRIARLTADSVEIAGAGDTYGDAALRRTYAWGPEWP